MDAELTHFDELGSPRMVDVANKPVTERQARASAIVDMAAETWNRIRNRGVAKGDVLEVARLAGVMAAKRTAELIPLCHPLMLEAIEVTFAFLPPASLRIEAAVRVTAKTGVEMEALTAACVAALTVYDMCKAMDRGMTIRQVRLEEKSGGRSGHYLRQEELT